MRDEAATGRGAETQGRIVRFLGIASVHSGFRASVGKDLRKTDRVSSALQIMLRGADRRGLVQQRIRAAPISQATSAPSRWKRTESSAATTNRSLIAAVSEISTRRTLTKAGGTGGSAGAPGRSGNADRDGRGRRVEHGHGRQSRELDFASVQRATPRCRGVLKRSSTAAAARRAQSSALHSRRRCGRALERPSGACPLAGRGARIDLRAVPNEEPGMTPRELWCNESQERFVLTVAAERIGSSSRSVNASAARPPLSAL